MSKQAVKIRENVYWVGGVDFGIRMFHGYRTPYGSTYNAYLVLDEKITLIDTTKAAFTDEMLERIGSVIDPARIDYIISNHVEQDHSGGLPRLSSLLPEAEILTSPNGEKGLRAHYKELLDRELRVVKTGDTLKTGKYTFRFALTPMVHWPDNMATYLEEEKILFSNDAFGQHIASEERYDDEIGLPRFLERSADYYANIVLPFGAQVKKALDLIAPLEISMVCPSHGVMLRSFLPEILGKYTFWSENGVDEKRAVIVYDSMWGATRLMAEHQCAELAAEGINAELVCLSDTHFSEAQAKLLEVRYIYVGSPTLNRRMLPTVAAFLEYLRGLRPTGRVGKAFGAYGWSGESVPLVEEALKGLGFEMRPSEKVLWKPGQGE